MNTPLYERLLCRGKRVNGEWIEGNILMTENWASILTCTDFCGSSDEPPSCDVREYEVVYETVGQYTGLTDKNGKRIFEGDIIEAFLDEEFPEDKTIAIVKWQNLCWCIEEQHFPAKPCSYPLEECDGEDWAVVGNIHDNPGLIKESAR